MCFTDLWVLARIDRMDYTSPVWDGVGLSLVLD